MRYLISSNLFSGWSKIAGCMDKSALGTICFRIRWWLHLMTQKRSCLSMFAYANLLCWQGTQAERAEGVAVVKSRSQAIRFMVASVLPGWHSLQDQTPRFAAFATQPFLNTSLGSVSPLSHTSGTAASSCKTSVIL